MNRVSPIVAAVALVAFSGVAAINFLPNAWAGNSTEAQSTAAEQIVTFAVEKMTCAACPITVRKAMERVEGVKSVAVDFDAKTATVVFDPAVATPDQIGAASTNAGYPASPTS
ncbi:MAG: heavy-metal-associated domain-containing protein [Gammaproteobacteria bacterium]|jgi:mercuric ion binding protein|nr:heavy-metal-associated domain-containing protein [Gammaproteobacteria bacterium]